MSGITYPDGRAVLDQPLLLLDAFATIGAGLAVARKSGGNQREA